MKRQKLGQRQKSQSKDIKKNTSSQKIQTKDCNASVDQISKKSKKIKSKGKKKQDQADETFKEAVTKFKKLFNEKIISHQTSKSKLKINKLQNNQSSKLTLCQTQPIQSIKNKYDRSKDGASVMQPKRVKNQAPFRKIQNKNRQISQLFTQMQEKLQLYKVKKKRQKTTQQVSKKNLFSFQLYQQNNKNQLSETQSQQKLKKLTKHQNKNSTEQIRFSKGLKEKDIKSLSILQKPKRSKILGKTEKTEKTEENNEIGLESHSKQIKKEKKRVMSHKLLKSKVKSIEPTQKLHKSQITICDKKCPNFNVQSMNEKKGKSPYKIVSKNFSRVKTPIKNEKQQKTNTKSKSQNSSSRVKRTKSSSQLSSKKKRTVFSKKNPTSKATKSINIENQVSLIPNCNSKRLLFQEKEIAKNPIHQLNRKQRILSVEQLDQLTTKRIKYGFENKDNNKVSQQSSSCSSLIVVYDFSQKKQKNAEDNQHDQTEVKCHHRQQSILNQQKQQHVLKTPDPLRYNKQAQQPIQQRHFQYKQILEKMMKKQEKKWLQLKKQLQKLNNKQSQASYSQHSHIQQKNKLSEIIKNVSIHCQSIKHWEGTTQSTKKEQQDQQNKISSSSHDDKKSCKEKQNPMTNQQTIQQPSFNSNMNIKSIHREFYKNQPYKISKSTKYPNNRCEGAGPVSEFSVEQYQSLNGSSVSVKSLKKDMDFMNFLHQNDLSVKKLNKNHHKENDSYQHQQLSRSMAIDNTQDKSLKINSDLKDSVADDHNIKNMKHSKSLLLMSKKRQSNPEAENLNLQLMSPAQQEAEQSSQLSHQMPSPDLTSEQNKKMHINKYLNRSVEIFCKTEAIDVVPQTKNTLVDSRLQNTTNNQQQHFSSPSSDSHSQTQTQSYTIQPIQCEQQDQNLLLSPLVLNTFTKFCQALSQSNNIDNNTIPYISPNQPAKQTQIEKDCCIKQDELVSDDSKNNLQQIVPSQQSDKVDVYGKQQQEKTKQTVNDNIVALSPFQQITNLTICQKIIKSATTWSENIHSLIEDNVMQALISEMVMEFIAQYSAHKNSGFLSVKKKPIIQRIYQANSQYLSNNNIQVNDNPFGGYNEQQIRRIQKLRSFYDHQYVEKFISEILQYIIGEGSKSSRIGTASAQYVSSSSVRNQLQRINKVLEKPLGVQTSIMLKYMRSSSNVRNLTSFFRSHQPIHNNTGCQGSNQPTEEQMNGSHHKQDQQKSEDESENEQGSQCEEEYDYPLSLQKFTEFEQLNVIEPFYQNNEQNYQSNKPEKENLNENQISSRKYFHQAIYDLVNLILDQLRPFGLNGRPPVCFEESVNLYVKGKHFRSFETIKQHVCKRVKQQIDNIKMGLMSFSQIPHSQIIKYIESNLIRYCQFVSSELDQQYAKTDQCIFETQYELMAVIQDEIISQEAFEIYMLRFIQEQRLLQQSLLQSQQ